MRKITLSTVSAIALLTAGAASAQDQSAYIGQVAGNAENTNLNATVTQDGGTATAVVVQGSSTVGKSLDDYVTVTQSGLSGAVYVNQDEGQRNNVTVTQSSGSANNTTLAYQFGNDNRTTVTQSGRNSANGLANGFTSIATSGAAGGAANTIDTAQGTRDATSLYNGAVVRQGGNNTQAEIRQGGEAEGALISQNASDSFASIDQVSGNNHASAWQKGTSQVAITYQNQGNTSVVQQGDASTGLGSYSRAVIDQSGYNNTSSAVQTGTGNHGVVEQYGQIGNSSIDQSGSGNYAYAGQEASGLFDRSTITQDSIGNVAGVRQANFNDQSTISQLGTMNSTAYVTQRADNAYSTVVQSGGSNFHATVLQGTTVTGAFNFGR